MLFPLFIFPRPLIRTFFPFRTGDNIYPSFSIYSHLRSALTEKAEKNMKAQSNKSMKIAFANRNYEVAHYNPQAPILYILKEEFFFSVFFFPFFAEWK
jgi:hypothetical protein